VPNVTEIRARFRARHREGIFVIPNPWDVGSARFLASLGFEALATTSSGFAWSQGRADNHVTLDQALAHFAALAAAVELPINADFEGGFARDPDGVADHVRRAADTGVAGISIEDSTGDPAAPLFELPLAVERMRAAAEALRGTDVLLVGRSEGFIAGRPDLDETLRRLQAYAEAGAECLYAPGVRAPEHIAAIVAAVAPKPVNVLVNTPFTTVAALRDLGVRRISVGGALARAAWRGFIDAAHEIRDLGTFERLAGAASTREIEAAFPGD
jgi:2-methylisocitrate lyase-like PEP mutase family enzyme